MVYFGVAIRSFKNSGTEDIAHGRLSKHARRILPMQLHSMTMLRLLKLDAISSLEDLRAFPSYRLEKLKGDRKEQYSIRINDKYRICFYWEAPDAHNVDIVDYH